VFADSDLKLSKGMFRRTDLESSTPAPALTKRQSAVLIELVKDQSMTDAAKTLDISVNTVDRHKARLFSIADAKTRVGLVRWAIRTGQVAA